MSRSTRWIVRPSNTPGWFVVSDTTGKEGPVELKGRSAANSRCRRLNEIDAQPARPVGYVEIECAGCGAILLTAPGTETVCPRCQRERDEIEARIAWEETREAEKLLAEAEMESSVRATIPLSLACVD